MICSSLNEKWSILLIGDAVGQIHFVDCSKKALSANFDSKSIDEKESDSLNKENTIKEEEEEEEETIEQILETISIPTFIQDINSSQNPSFQSEQQEKESERRKGISSISIRKSDYKLVAVGCWDSKVYLYSMKLGKKNSRKKLKVQLLSILGFHSSTVNTLVFQHPLLPTSEILNSSSDLQNDQIEEEKLKKNDDDENDENDDQTTSQLAIVKHPLLFTGSQDEKIGIWNLYSENQKKKK